MKDYFDDKEVREYFSDEPGFESFNDWAYGDARDRAEKEQWNKFLVRVKYGFKKVFGHLDDLTTILPQWGGKTLWERLKETGSVGYNMGGSDCGVAIDIEYGARIYISQWWPRETGN